MAEPATATTTDLGAGGRVLVFGGPYSNLEATLALQQVAASLEIPAHRIVCTGDVVAYCADPEATATLVRDWGIHVVAGNCEEQIGADALDCACGFGAGGDCDLLARTWYDFARRRVSDHNKAWMAGLSRRLAFRFAGHAIEATHGGFDTINRWVFPSTDRAIAEELAKSPASVVLAGHSGIPFARRVGRQTWFNPGVIGMPANDGVAGGWYGLLEAAPDGLRLSTHRLSYDHARAAAKLMAAGFADPYARALETGLWPSLDVLPDAERAAAGKTIEPLGLVLGAAPVARRGPDRRAE